MTLAKHSNEDGLPSAAIAVQDTAEVEGAKNPELASWWEFALEEDNLLRDVAGWEKVPIPTARDLAAREIGLAAARAALAEHRKRGELLQRDKVGATRTIATDSIISTGAEEELATLFDPVTVEELEAMFHADGQWKRWAERASDNGLKAARVGRGLFNPYFASRWFLLRGIPGWDHSRVDRVLSNNLPARSHDKREFFKRLP